MPTTQTSAPKKPFQSTYARLLKVLANGDLDLKQMKDAAAAPSKKQAKIKNSVAIDAAKAGQIRAATRNPDTTITALGKTATDLMSKLLAPPETPTRVTATMRESLKSIHDQHQTTAMGLQEDLKKIEVIRKRILEAVTQKPISHDEIKKLGVDTRKYFTEVEALEKKIIPFVKKIESQATNIVPSIQIPAEQKKLTNQVLPA